MRRASSVLLVLVALGVVATFALRHPNERAPQPDDPPAPELPPVGDGPARYVALGDSLATGAGATTSYVDLYATWLHRTLGVDVEVENLAADGWTTRDLLDAVRHDDRTRVAVEGAHVLTWDIGGNDLLDALASYLEGTCGGADGEACFRAAVAEAAGNVEALLGELRSLRAGDVRGMRTMDLYLPFLEDPHLSPFVSELRPYLDELNRHMTQLAEAQGVPVARVGAAFRGATGHEDPVAAGLIAEDGVHPSDRGHRVIAHELAALGPGGRPVDGVTS